MTQIQQDQLKPCPFCGGAMEDRGYGAIHVAGERCPLRDLAFDPARWNIRAPVTVQDAAKVLLDWWHQPAPDPCALVLEAKRAMGVMSALSEHSDDRFVAFDAALRAIAEGRE